MIHIKDHIEEHHNGNKSAFAYVQRVHRSHVYYWCKGDYYVHEGKLYHLTRPLSNRRDDDDET